MTSDKAPTTLATRWKPSGPPAAGRAWRALRGR
jgi:hypothetical protein